MKKSGDVGFVIFTFAMLLVSFVAAAPARAAVDTWTGNTSTLWSATGNWSTSVVPTSSDEADFGLGSFATSPSVDVSSSLGQFHALGGLMPSFTATINSGNVLTLYGTNNAGTGILVDLNSSSGTTVTISGGTVALGASQNWTNNNTNGFNAGQYSLTVSSAVNLGSNMLTLGGSGNTQISGLIVGAGSLALNGPGSLALTGSSSTYTAGTTISGGSLFVSSFGTGAGAASGSSPSSSVGSGPNQGVANSSVGTINLNNGTLIYNGPAITEGGPGKGTYRQFNLNGTASTIDTVTSLVIVGQMSNGTLTKTGPATTLAIGDWISGTNLTPDNTNLYANVSQGTLNLCRTRTTGTSLSTGPYAVYGVTNVSPGACLYDQAAAATLSGGDGQIPPTSGVANMNGTFDLVYNNCTIAYVTGSGTVTASGGLGYNPTLTLGYNNVSCEFDGVIQDGASRVAVAKTGSGTLILTGNSTYSLGTFFNGGVLQIGNSSALGNGYLTATAGTVDLNGLNTTIRGISGAGGIVLTNSAGSTPTLTVSPNSGYYLFYSGSLAKGKGTLTVIKSGNGAEFLAGADTYSGGTTINAGALGFTTTAALPTMGTTTIAIANGGALAATPIYNASQPVNGWLASGRIAPNPTGGIALLNGANDTEAITLSLATSALSLGAVLGTATYGGVLTPSGTTVYLGGGGGTLVFTPSLTGANSLMVGNGGLGTVALTAANSYTGGTTIGPNGLLLLTNANTNTGGTTISGGTLQLGTGAAGQDGSIVDTVVDNGSLVFNLFGSTTYSGVVSGSGGLTKTGGGALTLTGSNITYSGTTALNAGTLVLAFSSGGPASNIINNNSALTLAGGGLVIIRGANAVANSQQFNGLNVNAGGGYLQAFNGSGGTLNVNLGAINRSVGGTVDFMLPGTGSITTAATGSTVGNVLLSASTAYATVNGGSTWATAPSGGGSIAGLTSYTQTDTFTGNKLATTLLTQNNIPSGGTATTGLLTFGGAGINLQLGSINSDLVDTGGILVTPAATGAEISGGSIHAGGGNAVVIIDYGSLNVNTHIVDGAAASSLTVAGTSITTLTLAGQYSGTTYVNAGATLAYGIANALPHNTGKGGVTVNGTIDIQNNTANINGLSGGGVVNDSLGAGSLIIGQDQSSSVFNGTIENTGGTLALSKIGGGLFTLTGNNTYTGGTTVTAGALQLGSNTALPAGTVATINSTLDMNTYNASVSHLTGVGTIDTVAGGTPTLTVTDGNFAGTLQNTAGHLALAKVGPLLLQLSGINSFSGGTTISGGTLQLGSASALGAGGIVANAGVLDLNGINTNYSVGVTTLGGSAGLITDNSFQYAIPTVFTVTKSGSFGGILADGASGQQLALVMDGAGELVLSGSNNAYHGGTVVDAGELVLNTIGAIPAETSLIVGANATTIFGPSAGAAPVSGNAIASPEGIGAVPEPGSLVLLGVAGIAAAAAAWRRRKRR